MIQFLCPGCQRTIKARDSAAGRNSKCPRCGAAVQIPQVEATSAHDPAAQATRASAEPDLPTARALPSKSSRKAQRGRAASGAPGGSRFPAPRRVADGRPAPQLPTAWPTIATGGSPPPPPPVSPNSSRTGAAPPKAVPLSATPPGSPLDDTTDGLLDAPPVQDVAAAHTPPVSLSLDELLGDAGGGPRRRLVARDWLGFFSGEKRGKDTGKASDGRR